jgi:hypothetical protein
MREHFAATDTRLPPLERARLGARGTIFGSQAVNRLFNQMTGEIGRLSLNAERLDPDMLRMRARVVVGGIMDQLEAAIRRELGADRIQLDAGPPAERAAAPRHPGTGPG